MKKNVDKDHSEASLYIIREIIDMIGEGGQEVEDEKEEDGWGGGRES